MPLNITAASDPYGHFNLMPVYGILSFFIHFECSTKLMRRFYSKGLNVYSMLKHQTLVLTLAAVERIEERLLFHLHRNDASESRRKFQLDSN